MSKAVNLIVDTQNAEGGWRYQPQRRDADISVTICQVMALPRHECRTVRAAHDHRSLHRIRQTQPERRWRIHVYVAGRSQARFLVRPPARRASQRWHLEGPAIKNGLALLMKACRAAMSWLVTVIIFMAIITRCRRCGMPAATVGGNGIRRFATNCLPDNGTTVRGGLDLSGIWHRHGLHHLADADELSADFPRLNGTHPLPPPPPPPPPPSLHAVHYRVCYCPPSCYPTARLPPADAQADTVVPLRGPAFTATLANVPRPTARRLLPSASHRGRCLRLILVRLGCLCRAACRPFRSCWPEGD